MDIVGLTEHVKKRIKKGESLHSIMHNLPQKGLSNKQKEEIISRVVSEEDSEGMFRAKRNPFLRFLFPSFVPKKIMIVLLILVVLSVSFYLFNIFRINSLEKIYSNYSETDISEPVMVPYRTKEPIFSGHGESITFDIIPVAKYKATVQVLGKSFNENSMIMKTIQPVNVAFVWGELAEPENQGLISYEYGLKTLFGETEKEQVLVWRCGSRSRPCPYSRESLHSQVSNNHIFPVNENVYEGLKRLESGQKAYFEGYLMNAVIRYRGYVITLKSSTSLSDQAWSLLLRPKNTITGNCESLYLVKLRFNDSTYE